MRRPKTTSILITLGFLLTLNAEGSGWCERGRAFFPPLHSYSPPFYPLFLIRSPPQRFDRESESHPRSPIPRLTIHPAHCTQLVPPSSSNVHSLLAVSETSSTLLLLNPCLLPLLHWLFLCAASVCCIRWCGQASLQLVLISNRQAASQDFLAVDQKRLLQCFGSYFWGMLFLKICHLVTVQAFLSKHTGTDENSGARYLNRYVRGMLFFKILTKNI